MNANGQAKINHIAVYVEDLEESGRFYEQVIGIEEIDEPFNDGLHLWYDVGGGASLHLIEREEPWSTPAVDKTNHLCFSVPDMDRIIANLDEYSIPFEDWPGNAGEVTIRPDGIRQIYLKDPSGYWLEINDDY
ncbi:MAG: VOC family protein [Balneolaceae bacterium]